MFNISIVVESPAKGLISEKTIVFVKYTDFMQVSREFYLWVMLTFVSLPSRVIVDTRAM